jgi:apolipoprotein N-acyltransferase
MPFINLPTREVPLILPKIRLSKDVRDVFLTVILFVASFPPSPLGILIYLSFIPLLAICVRHTVKNSFRLTYAAGILINLISFYYVFNYSVFNFGLLVLVNALQFGLFGVIQAHIFSLNKPTGYIFFPLVWTALEYLRQFGDLGFTWLSLAYTQTYYLPLIQVADITGYLGITFWICVVNVVLFQMWQNRSKIYRIKLFGLATLAFLLLCVYGMYKINSIMPKKSIRVSYIQPNFATHHTWSKRQVVQNAKILLAATDSLSESAPDIIIWPETSIPLPISKNENLLNTIKCAANKYNSAILFGTQDFTLNGQDTLLHNSVVLCNHTTPPLQVYHKLRLVPLVEGKLFARIFSFAYRQNTSFAFLTPGKEARVLWLRLGDTAQQDNTVSDFDTISPGDSNVVGVGAMICFESIFPNLAREYRKLGSNMLAVVTNDAWFGNSTQPYHHFQTAIYRAIENRISVVQSANSGVSGFIDPVGRTLHSSEVFVAAKHTIDVPINNQVTLYTHLGDWLGNLSLILSIFLYIYSLYISKRGVIDSKISFN